MLPTAWFLRRIVLSGHQVSSVCSNLRNLSVIVIKLLIYTNMSGACLLSLSLPPSPENRKSWRWKMFVGAFVPSRRDYSQFACQLSRKSSIDTPQLRQKVSRSGQVTPVLASLCTCFLSTSVSILRFWPWHIEPFMIRHLPVRLWSC